MTNDAEKERLKRYTSAMGDELGLAYAELTRNLVDIRIVWQQYCQLFGADQETINLLNRTSGLFFQVVERELWDMVLIAITRITDPASSGRKDAKKNLTLRSLPELISDDALRESVIQDLTVARSSSDSAREHRNKRIAHQDDTYVRTRHEADALPPISRRNVEEAIHALGEVLDNIRRHYMNSEMDYSDFVAIDGAETLLQKLRRLEELEKQRIGWNHPTR
ncbi:AbiU2 domain-containing protein [Stenotrophomonas geniculata]